MEIKQANKYCKLNRSLLKIPTGGRLLSWLSTKPIEELNMGPPHTNQSSGREENLKPGAPDYKPSTLTTRPMTLFSQRRARNDDDELLGCTTSLKQLHVTLYLTLQTALN